MNINLNRREKIVVAFGGIFLVIFLLFHIAIVPVFEKRGQLESEIAASQLMAREMHELRREYLLLVERMEATQKEYTRRPENFSLFSFLERIAGSIGIKNKIAYMRPSSTVDDFSGLTISRVEMRLEEVTMEDLASYLYEIESSDNMLQVDRLTITKSGEGDSPVNVVMRVQTAAAS